MPRSLVWIRSGAAVLLAVMLLAGCAHAPKATPGTGALRGRVTDEHGKPLHYANVTVLGAQTGGQTNVQGDFTIINVPVGVHTVRVSMVGFARQERAAVRVRAKKSTTVDIRLQPKPIDTLPPDWVD